MKPQTQEVHGTLLEDISAAPDTEGPKNPPEHPGPFSPGRCRKLCADAPRKAGSHGDSAWSTAWRAASKAHRMGCPSTHLLLRLIPPGPPAKVSSRCKMKTRSLPLDSSCLKETPQSLPPPCSTARAGQCLPQGRIWPSWRHSWVSQLGRMLLTSTGTSTHDPAHPVRHRPPPPRHASPCWGSPDAGRAQGRACNHSALPPAKAEAAARSPHAWPRAPSWGKPGAGDGGRQQRPRPPGGPRGLGEPWLRGLRPWTSGPWAVLLLLQHRKKQK